MHEWSSDEDFSSLCFLTLLAHQQISTSTRNIVWIDNSVTPLPHYMIESSRSEKILEKSFFINCSSLKKRLWLLDQTTRTKGVGLIIAEVEGLTRTMLKRLSIAIKSSGAIVLFNKKAKAKNVAFNFTAKCYVAYRCHNLLHPDWKSVVLTYPLTFCAFPRVKIISRIDVGFRPSSCSRNGSVVENSFFRLAV